MTAIYAACGNAANGQAQSAPPSWFAMLRVPALLCVFCASLLTTVARSADIATPQAVPPHLRDAELLVEGLDANHNVYDRHDCFIHWKGEDGAAIDEARTDCSVFLDLLLEHSYGISPQALKTLTGHLRPDARQWYATIRTGKCFEIISHVSDLRPGDVIAVQFPPGEDDTGHIMLVDALPSPRESTPPLVDGCDQWELPIIDSTKSGHGPTDTRRQPDGSSSSGIGKGVLRLYRFHDGTIAGYCWSVLGKSKFQGRDVHPLVIGRLQLKQLLALQ